MVTASRSGFIKKRSNGASKPSARYQRVLEDDNYAEALQKTFSPSVTTNASTRTLPLHLVKQRDGTAYRFPFLADLCLEVVAKNFLTHVLPSQQVYDEAKGLASTKLDQKGKGKQPTNVRTTLRPKSVSISSLMGEVTKSIGKKRRRVQDSEDGDGQEYMPLDDSDPNAEMVGVAAGPSKQLRKTKGKTSRRSVASRPSIPMQDLVDLSQESHQLLKLLPDATMLKLLRLLKRSCPSALTRTILTTYFVSGRLQVELDASMTLLAERPEQINLIVGAAGQSASFPSSLAKSPSHTLPALTKLSLSGLLRLSPQALSTLFRRSPMLQEVIVKGCVQIDASCMQALVDGGSANTLRVLNVNFTDVGLKGVEVIISNARALVVLKIANVLGLKDQVVPAMIRKAILHASEKSPPFLPLENLRCLKVRGTEMSVVGLSSFVQLCKPTLVNLDIGSLNINTGDQATLLAMSLGYGDVADNANDSSLPLDVSAIRAPLCKLNLSNNFQDRQHHDQHRNPLEPLIPWLAQMQSTLRTLILDGLPLKVDTSDLQSYFTRITSALSSQSSGQDTADTKVPANASSGILTRCSLSATDRTVLTPRDFWIRLGDQAENWSLLAAAETVNLSRNDLRLSKYFSNQFESNQPYTVPEHWSETFEKRPWTVKYLDLSNTHIGDLELNAFAERCTRLERIDLEATAVTAEGVYALIGQCRYLTSINLTGCRGVPIRQRRNIFEFI